MGLPKAQPVRIAHRLDTGLSGTCEGSGGWSGHAILQHRYAAWLLAGRGAGRRSVIAPGLATPRDLESRALQKAQD